MTTYCGECGYVVPSRHVCRLVAAEKRLKEENEKLRAENERLAQFVIQKCPECGAVTAPNVEG